MWEEPGVESKLGRLSILTIGYVSFCAFGLMFIAPRFQLERAVGDYPRAKRCRVIKSNVPYFFLVRRLSEDQSQAAVM